MNSSNNLVPGGALVEQAADSDNAGGFRIWGFLELHPTKQESWGPRCS